MTLERVGHLQVIYIWNGIIIYQQKELPKWHKFQGQSCVNMSKKTQDEYNELNDDDTNDDTDGVDIINDLE